MITSYGVTPERCRRGREAELRRVIVECRRHLRGEAVLGLIGSHPIRIGPEQTFQGLDRGWLEGRADLTVGRDLEEARLREPLDAGHPVTDLVEGQTGEHPHLGRRVRP